MEPLVVGVRRPTVREMDITQGSDALISQREAQEHFGLLGIDRETARRMLLAGLVRPVHRQRGATLYREADVLAFLRRYLVTPPAVTDGILVVLRSHPRRADPASPVGWSGIDLTAPPDEQLVAARAGGRGMSVVTRAYIRAVAERDGCVPMVATVGSAVALAAEILEPVPREESAERRRPAWMLRPAGAWGQEWHGLHLPTSPGGSSWRVLGPPDDPFVSAPRRRSGLRSGGTS
jgi:hypothetical protein